MFFEIFDFDGSIDAQVRTRAIGKGFIDRNIDCDGAVLNGGIDT